LIDLTLQYLFPELVDGVLVGHFGDGELKLSVVVAVCVGGGAGPWRVRKGFCIVVHPSVRLCGGGGGGCRPVQLSRVSTS